MAIRYGGMEFDTVEELVKYKKLIEENGKKEDEIAPKPKYIIPKKVRFWTDEEVRKLKDLMDSSGGRVSSINLQRLSNEIGRSYYATVEKYQILRRENIVVRKQKPSTKNQLRWSKAETDELKKLVEYYDGKVPIKKIEELATTLGRGFSGTLKKYYKLKNKKGSFKKSVRRWTDAEKAELKSIVSDGLYNLKDVDEFAEKHGFRQAQVVPMLYNICPNIRRIPQPMTKADFVANKAMGYSKQGMDGGEALARAKDEYNSRFNKARITEPDSLPIVYPIHEDSLPQFEALVKFTVANGGNITYHAVLNTLMLKNDLEWDGRIWVEFCRQFMEQSFKIAAYFGVKDRFSIQKVGGYHVIKYTK